MPILMVTISPLDTVIEVLRGTDDMSMLLAPNPRAVVKNMFLTGPQEPPDARKRRVGLFACFAPEEDVIIEKLLEDTVCLE